MGVFFCAEEVRQHAVVEVVQTLYDFRSTRCARFDPDFSLLNSVSSMIFDLLLT